MTNYDILQEYEAHKTPVPSYEEYNRLKEVERKKGKLVNVNYKIKQENQQLKELLKECKPYISYDINIKKYVGWTPPEANLLAKIKDAIGEK